MSLIHVSMLENWRIMVGICPIGYDHGYLFVCNGSYMVVEKGKEGTDDARSKEKEENY